MSLKLLKFSLLKSCMKLGFLELRWRAMSSASCHGTESSRWPFKTLDKTQPGLRECCWQLQLKLEIWWSWQGELEEATSWSCWLWLWSNDWFKACKTIPRKESTIRCPPMPPSDSRKQSSKRLERCPLFPSPYTNSRSLKILKLFCGAWISWCNAPFCLWEQPLKRSRGQ